LRSALHAECTEDNDRTRAPIFVNAVSALRVEPSNDGSQATPALRECVARATRRYLTDFGDHPAQHLYRLVLAEVEAPLISEVLRHCRGNQTRAAQMLGITRATLRKKLGDLGLV
jgi:Fis family transcriptional regulator